VSFWVSSGDWQGLPVVLSLFGLPAIMELVTAFLCSHPACFSIRRLSRGWVWAQSHMQLGLRSAKPPVFIIRCYLRQLTQLSDGIPSSGHKFLWFHPIRHILRPLLPLYLNRNPSLGKELAPKLNQSAACAEIHPGAFERRLHGQQSALTPAVVSVFQRTGSSEPVPPLSTTGQISKPRAMSSSPEHRAGKRPRE
jgi:hypothetical protein